MLESLHIENIAVIASLDLSFQDGFTVLSGETGAGKSVILDSIRLILGCRGEKEWVRYGEMAAYVSAIFSNLTPASKESLSKMGIFPDTDGCLLLERTLTTDGKNTARCNGRTVTLSLLRDIGNSLISIHGQNATASLMKEETQRQVLDHFGATDRELAAYTPLYQKLSGIREEIAALQKAETEKERMLDILRYQIADIETVSPKIGEEAKLIEKRALLRNQEKITKQAGFV